MDAWNDGSCDNGDALNYPDFTQSSACSTNPCISVTLVTGSYTDGSGQHPIARYNAGSHEIEIYTQSGTPLTATNLSDAHVRNYVAHELGHALGLDEDTCADGAMNSAYAGGETPVYPTSEECTAADNENTTYYEYYGYEPGDYDPWQSCLNVCPCQCFNWGCDWTCTYSPIVIDLDRKGYQLTGLDDPVSFDIDADGLLETLGWTKRNTRQGFLCLDRNQNGRIDSGAELFGNYALLSNGETAANGFRALADFDKPEQGGNNDGVIDSRDAIFNRLRVWVDRNHNGRSESDEIFTLAQAGVLRIELRYEYGRRTDQYGNEFRFKGRAWLRSGTESLHPVRVYDVYFVGHN
jgi:hypothetical protein